MDNHRLLSDNLSPASCFSEDSMYSFDSFDVPYEMDADFEDMQANLLKPLHQDEHCRLRSLAITDELKRMCLSDAYLDVCMNLDKTCRKINTFSKTPQKCQSDQFSKLSPQYNPRKLSKNGAESGQEEDSKVPIWIVNHSNSVDSKRFLVEWLTASAQDVPLVVYQSSNGAMCTDVIAAICSWIEEQTWTTEELFNALQSQNGNI